jgi:hypothetical protein
MPRTREVCKYGAMVSAPRVLGLRGPIGMLSRKIAFVSRVLSLIAYVRSISGSILPCVKNTIATYTVILLSASILRAHRPCDPVDPGIRGTLTRVIWYNPAVEN